MGRRKTKHAILIELVASRYDIPIMRLLSRRREKPIPEARQFCSYVLKYNTKLSLKAIAEVIGYKSHASPIRDIKLINQYMDLYPQFREKAESIILEARATAKAYDQGEKVLSPEPGMVCWFWNEDLATNLPVLGTLMHSYYNEEKLLRFVTRENPETSFSECEYAGIDAIPEKFRGMMEMKSGKDEKSIIIRQE